MVGIAYAASTEGAFELHNFHDTLSLTLGVRDEGMYLVFARVDILNRDGDHQNCVVKITSRNGTNLLDRVTLRIPGGNTRVAVPLQGTLRVPHDTKEIIEIRCNTFNGVAQESSLFAVQISELKFSAA